jgi:hypothetical protein
MADDAGKGKDLSPPYTSFQSLKNLFGTLKENGIPGRIDRSLLNKFSGQVASQILTALRFLKLTDGQGHPTAALEAVVNASGTDDWPAALSDVIKAAYAPLFSLNLASASPSQFNDTFRAAYNAEGDTFRKCMTFFLNAAREAKIPVSAYIMQNKKPRGPVAQKKRAPKVSIEPKGDAATPKDTPEDKSPEDNAKTILSGMTPEQVLLDILDPAEMSTEEQQAVFALLLYLKKSKAVPKQSGGQ